MRKRFLSQSNKTLKIRLNFFFQKEALF